jgi:hypothetical protein
MILHTGKFHAATIPRPNPSISATYSRLDEENPDLSVEEILDLTAAHYRTSRETIVKKLWGTK